MAQGDSFVPSAARVEPEVVDGVLGGGGMGMAMMVVMVVMAVTVVMVAMVVTATCRNSRIGGHSVCSSDGVAAHTIAAAGVGSSSADISLERHAHRTRRQAHSAARLHL